MPLRFSTLLIVSLIVIICFSFAVVVKADPPVCTGPDNPAGCQPPPCTDPDVPDVPAGCQVPTGTGDEGTVWILNPLKIDTVQGLIDLVLNWLLMIAIPLSTIVILYGAVLFMTSGGDKGRTKKARDVIRDVVIGIIILLLAKGISYSIVSFLTP